MTRRRMHTLLGIAIILTIIIATNINAEIVTNNLISWWKFDETGTATVASDSHGSNHGTLTGFGASPAWTNDTPGSASSGALYFDGVNDYIDCGTGFTTISNEITVEVWMKHMGTGSSDPTDIYFSKYVDTNYRWYFRLRSDDTVDAFGRSGGANIFSPTELHSDAVVNSNVWHHVAVTAKRNDSCIWYVDGKEAGSGTILDVSFVNAGSVVIGDLLNHIHATLDDVRIYDRALTAKEVLQNYRTMIPLPVPTGVVTDGLISYWTFDDGGGQLAYDSQGNNSGTLNGFGVSPAWTNDTPASVSSGALYFDGVNDYIDCGTGFAAISNEITVEVWMKHMGTGSSDSTDIYFSKYEDTNYRWYFRLRSDDTVDAFGRSGGANIFSPTELHSDAVVDSNVWHHVAVTAKRNDSCIWYVDGKEAGTGTILDVSFENAGSVVIGDLLNHIHATLDDVRIYDRALSTTEILQNYRVIIPASGTIIIIK